MASLQQTSVLKQEMLNDRMMMKNLLLSSEVKGLSWSYPARVWKPENFSIQGRQWVKLKSSLRST